MLSDLEIEALVEILELCGFLDNPTSTVDHGRLGLVASIKSLEARLVTEDDHMHRHEGQETSVLEFESVAEAIRKEITSYIEELELERAKVFAVAKQFNDSVSSDAWIISCRAIERAYAIQNQAEELASRKVLKALDNLYCSVEERELRESLSALSVCLRRGDLILRPDLLDIVDAVNGIGGDAKRVSPRAILQQKRASNHPNEGVVPDVSVVASTSIWDAVKRYETSLKSQEADFVTRLTKILIVGPQGSGKTHICDRAEDLLKDSCEVIRPNLPLDILGSSVGQMEDILISVFAAAKESHYAAVLLDGIDSVLIEESSETKDKNAVSKSSPRRAVTTFLSLVDSIKRSASIGSNVLVVCTTSRESDASFARFDRVFHLNPPDTSQRRQLLESFSSFDSNDAYLDKRVDGLLNELTEATIGRTYPELKQYFRQVFEQQIIKGDDPRSPSTTTLLLALKDALHGATPESLKSGSLQQSVEMTIFSSRELLSDFPVPDCTTYLFPMKGASAIAAWEKLKATIVVPLCYSKDLKALLCKDSHADKTRAVTGGILLSGESGTGKSEIALHCARYASSLLPSLKTLSVSCTSLIHKEIGESERSIKRLFDSARKSAPCILIMDGIENIAAMRGNDPTTEGTLDRVLSTLLIEVDGIGTTGRHLVDGSVAVIGITTNAKWIDPALKRPGRLEKTLVLHRI